MSSFTSWGGAIFGARRSAVRRGWLLALLPGLVFLLVFFLYPLLLIAFRSVTDPGPHNYVTVLGDPVYRKVLGTTFRIAFITTLATMALGYPYAYLMSRSSRGVAALMTGVVLMPFWSSLLVRTFSWTVLLQDTGLINTLLIHLRFISQPLSLIRTGLGVEIGMVHVLLPYMVLPLYATMSGIDRTLIAAAEGLGAAPRRAFRRIFLPLSLPGVYAGATLVFMLSVGFYITPSLLGDPGDAMLGEVIVNQVTHFGFGLGAALGMVLLIVTLAILGAAAGALRLQGRSRRGD